MFRRLRLICPIALLTLFPCTFAPAAEPGDTAKKLVGEWLTPIGDPRLLGGGTARYHFNADGTFTLTFLTLRNPGTGSGTWRLDGRRLTMVDRTSDTLLIQAGDVETADVVLVDDSTLTLASTDMRGRPETDRLTRVPAFKPGAEDGKLAGTWTGSGLLTLSPNGRAAVDQVGFARTGVYMQTGSHLIIRLAPPPQWAAAAATTAPSSRPAQRLGMEETLFEIDKDASSRDLLVLQAGERRLLFERKSGPTTR